MGSINDGSKKSSAAGRVANAVARLSNRPPVAEPSRAPRTADVDDPFWGEADPIRKGQAVPSSFRTTDGYSIPRGVFGDPDHDYVDFTSKAAPGTSFSCALKGDGSYAVTKRVGGRQTGLPRRVAERTLKVVVRGWETLSGELHKGATSPKGFVPIPGSRRGGWRKKVGAKWVYWYPDGQSDGATVQALRDEATATGKSIRDMLASKLGQELKTTVIGNGVKQISSWAEVFGVASDAWGDKLAEIQSGWENTRDLKLTLGDADGETYSDDAFKKGVSFRSRDYDCEFVVVRKPDGTYQISKHAPGKTTQYATGVPASTLQALMSRWTGTTSLGSGAAFNPDADAHGQAWHSELLLFTGASGVAAVVKAPMFIRTTVSGANVKAEKLKAVKQLAGQVVAIVTASVAPIVNPTKPKSVTPQAVQQAALTPDAPPIVKEAAAKITTATSLSDKAMAILKKAETLAGFMSQFRKGLWAAARTAATDGVATPSAASFAGSDAGTQKKAIYGAELRFFKSNAGRALVEELNLTQFDFSKSYDDFVNDRLGIVVKSALPLVAAAKPEPYKAGVEHGPGHNILGDLAWAFYGSTDSASVKKSEEVLAKAVVAAGFHVSGGGTHYKTFDAETTQTAVAVMLTSTYLQYPYNIPIGVFGGLKDKVADKVPLVTIGQSFSADLADHYARIAATGFMQANSFRTLEDLKFGILVADENSNGSAAPSDRAVWGNMAFLLKERLKAAEAEASAIGTTPIQIAVRAFATEVATLDKAAEVAYNQSQAVAVAGPVGVVMSASDIAASINPLKIKFYKQPVEAAQHLEKRLIAIGFVKTGDTLTVPIGAKADAVILYAEQANFLDTDAFIDPDILVKVTGPNSGIIPNPYGATGHPDGAAAFGMLKEHFVAKDADKMFRENSFHTIDDLEFGVAVASNMFNTKVGAQKIAWMAVQDDLEYQLEIHKARLSASGVGIATTLAVRKFSEIANVRHNEAKADAAPAAPAPVAAGPVQTTAPKPKSDKLLAGKAGLDDFRAAVKELEGAHPELIQHKTIIGPDGGRYIETDFGMKDMTPAYKYELVKASRVLTTNGRQWADDFYPDSPIGAFKPAKKDEYDRLAQLHGINPAVLHDVLRATAALTSGHVIGVHYPDIAIAAAAKEAYTRANAVLTVLATYQDSKGEAATKPPPVAWRYLEIPAKTLAAMTSGMVLPIDAPLSFSRHEHGGALGGAATIDGEDMVDVVYVVPDPKQGFNVEHLSFYRSEEEIIMAGSFGVEEVYRGRTEDHKTLSKLPGKYNGGSSKTYVILRQLQQAEKAVLGLEKGGPVKAVKTPMKVRGVLAWAGLGAMAEDAHRLGTGEPITNPLGAEPGNILDDSDDVPARMVAKGGWTSKRSRDASQRLAEFEAFKTGGTVIEKPGPLAAPPVEEQLQRLLKRWKAHGLDKTESDKQVQHLIRKNDFRKAVSVMENMIEAMNPPRNFVPFGPVHGAWVKARNGEATQYWKAGKLFTPAVFGEQFLGEFNPADLVKTSAVEGNDISTETPIGEVVDTGVVEEAERREAQPHTRDLREIPVLDGTLLQDMYSVNGGGAFRS